jgi:hypothetical protein
VSDAEARVAELAEERARLWDEVQRLRAERREDEYLERRMAQMEHSLSWRVTSPLRAGKTLAVKVRRRLQPPT